MAISSTGPISFENLRTEFGVSTGQTNISLDLMFSGFYDSGSPPSGQQINRNTESGRNIFNAALNATDLNLSLFRGYNNTAPIHWSHYILNTTSFTLSVGIKILVGANVYSLFGNSISPSGEFFDDNVSTGWAPTSADVLVSVTGREDLNVTINCYDQDASNTVYNDSTLTPFTDFNIGTVYGHQRFYIDITIT